MSNLGDFIKENNLTEEEKEAVLLHLKEMRKKPSMSFIKKDSPCDMMHNGCFVLIFVVTFNRVPKEPLLTAEIATVEKEAKEENRNTDETIKEEPIEPVDTFDIDDYKDTSNIPDDFLNELSARAYEISPTDKWDDDNPYNDWDDWQICVLEHPTEYDSARAFDAFLKEKNSFILYVYSNNQDKAWKKLNNNLRAANRNAVGMDAFAVEIDPDTPWRAYLFTERNCKGYICANKWVKKMYKEAVKNDDSYSESWFGISISTTKPAYRFYQLPDTVKLYIISTSDYFACYESKEERDEFEVPYGMIYTFDCGEFRARRTDLTHIKPIGISLLQEMR